MRSLFFIIFTFYIATANAEENTQINTPLSHHHKSHFDEAALKKAESLIKINQPIGIELTNTIIRISESTKHSPINAKAHILLGNAAYMSNNSKQILHHFLQASYIYKKLKDTQNQIKSSIHYISVLLDEKRYEQAEAVIDELLTVAQQYGERPPIGLTLKVKALSYFRQKQFEKAIEFYTQALEYLVSNDKYILEQLGEIHNNIALSYKRMQNRLQTAFYYRKALDIYSRLNNKKLIAHTLKTLAETENHLGNFVIALEYSIRSLEVYKQVDDPLRHNKAIMGAGIIYRNIGRYEESLKYVYKSYLYYKKENNANGIAKASNQLGLIYTKLRQFDQARSFYQSSIDLSKKNIQQSTLASAYREMAVIDYNEKNYDSAMIMAKKSYSIYQKEKNKLKSSQSARILADIYRAQKDKKNAVIYYRESLALASEINSIKDQIKAQTALADILIGENTNEAISLLTISVELSNQHKFQSEMLSAYRRLRIAEKELKNYHQSLKYAEKEIALTAIIQEEKDNNKLILAKANLHSHKMEVELETLREKAIYAQLELSKKNNEIEITEQIRTISELELSKNKYANIMLVLLLILTLLLAIFIYRRFIDSTKRNRELDYLAARDPLTNCFNRRILFEHMKQDFSNKKGLEQYCIIMADIDYFKKVNDTHGHSAGDSVLRGVANIFQGCVRQNDIVTRFGGEEFCIVLHQVSQIQAIKIAETMRYKVEKSRFEDIAVTCSFGVTSIEFNAKSPTELINQADIALYQSKSLGRNQVTLWDEILNKRDKSYE